MYLFQYKPLTFFAVIFLLIFFLFILSFLFPKIFESKTNRSNAFGTISNNGSQKPSNIGYPSAVLDITNWKLTIPSIRSGNALEIKQPELATYVLDPWFVLTPEKDAVRFRAAVNGSTTSGSDYPRSELREMTSNGKVNASWSTSKGIHTMIINQAVTAAPKIKKDIVVGQIHDDNKDIIVIRLNYPILHVRVDGKNVFILDSNYTFGKKFSVKFEVSNNQTKIYYNDSLRPVYTLNKKYSNAYFKAGAYTQSNCSKEGKSNCNDANYGEVLIYGLTVLHS